MKKADIKLLGIVVAGVLCAGFVMNQFDALEPASDGFNK